MIKKRDMYCKIEQTFLKELDDWSIFQDTILPHSKYISGNVILEYFGIKNVDLFRKQHTHKFFSIPPCRIRYVKITGTGILQPHRDQDTTVTLNYYISANGDQTIFYNTISSDVAPIKTKSYLYILDSLVEIDKFVSNSNEAYLLDVSQIHAVVKTNPEPRIFISYQWTGCSYDQILKDLNSQ